MLLNEPVVCFFLLLSSMYDDLFIHSPIEKHLSCFQILTIMNKGLKPLTHRFSFLLGKCLIVEGLVYV